MQASLCGAVRQKTLYGSIDMYIHVCQLLNVFVTGMSECGGQFSSVPFTHTYIHITTLSQCSDTHIHHTLHNVHTYTCIRYTHTHTHTHTCTHTHVTDAHTNSHTHTCSLMNEVVHTSPTIGSNVEEVGHRSLGPSLLAFYRKSQ